MGFCEFLERKTWKELGKYTPKNTKQMDRWVWYGFSATIGFPALARCKVNVCGCEVNHRLLSGHFPIDLKS